jgi:hypothetical protein
MWKKIAAGICLLYSGVSVAFEFIDHVDVAMDKWVHPGWLATVADFADRQRVFAILRYSDWWMRKATKMLNRAGGAGGARL